MKTVATAIVIMGFCILLLCVRIIFGRKGKRQFPHGHACRHDTAERDTRHG